MMCDASQHSDNWLLISRHALEEDPELYELIGEIDITLGSLVLVRPIDDDACRILLEAAAADPPPYEPADYI